MKLLSITSRYSFTTRQKATEIVYLHEGKVYAIDVACTKYAAIGLINSAIRIRSVMQCHINNLIKDFEFSVISGQLLEYSREVPDQMGSVKEVVNSAKEGLSNGINPMSVLLDSIKRLEETIKSM